MTREEKLEAIADVLEVEIDELEETKELEEFETWDSVAVLGIIAFMNEKFDKSPHATEVRQCKTIGELIDFIAE